MNKPNIIPYIVRREKSDYLADKLPKKYDGKEAIRIECEIPNDMIEIHQPKPFIHHNLMQQYI